MIEVRDIGPADPIVAADDQLVEDLRAGRPVDDPLARLLARWRREVETAPTPLDDGPVR